MRCQKVRSFLSAYCKSELTERRRQEVASHLDDCTDCQKEYNNFKEIFASTKRIEAVGVSDDFNNRLLNRIAGERFKETAKKAYLPKNAPILGWGKVTTVVATACFIMAFVFTGGVGILQEDPNGGQEMAELTPNTIGEDYAMVQPENNPNMNDNAFKAHTEANWEFKKELARVNRMKGYMNSLAGYSNDFNSSHNSLSNIIAFPEKRTIVMRLPFGNQTPANSGGSIMVSGN